MFTFVLLSLVTLTIQESPPVPEPCVDKNQWCPSWSQKGECEKNPDFMLKKCKKSCEVCTPDEEEEEPECVDAGKHCKWWSKQGECEKNPDFMLIKCKKSCKVCTPDESLAESEPEPCVDKNQWCPSWSRGGYCEKNPDFMLKKCEKSCDICTPGEEEEEPECVDNNKHCKRWSKQGECEKNPDYMLIKCKKSCKVCTPDEPPTPEPCVDTVKNCKRRSKKGQCETNPDFMLKKCKKSCEVCTPDHEEENAPPPPPPIPPVAKGCSGDRCVVGAGGKDAILAPGESITAKNGGITLLMQTDGNLVLYCPGGVPVWHSNTWVPYSNRHRLVIKNSGEMIVVNESGHQKWSSYTDGNRKGVTLVAQNDNNLVLYTKREMPGGYPIWHTNTWHSC